MDDKFSDSPAGDPGDTPGVKASLVSVGRPRAEDRSYSQKPVPATIEVVRWLVVLAMAAVTAYFVLISIHWPLLLDSPVMHYVNFLMRHGMRPYTDITDNNMPGAYYTEGLAMRVFGGSDLAWRMYDYFLMAVMFAALVLIARPYDWRAGVFAGGMFLAIHGPEGPNFAVEREQVITVLLVVGYVALFSAVRQRRPVWMLLFGLAGGVAASIKPTFLPLSLGLLVLAAYVLRKQRVAMLPYVSWAVAGLVAVFTYDILFLLRYHAVQGFVFVVREVLPAYGAQRRVPLHALVTSFDHRFLLLVLLGIALAAMSWRSWSWERWALLLGAGFAALSYVVQGKGFPHHRYAIYVPVLLLIGTELMQGLRGVGTRRWVAVAGCLFVLLVMVPRQMLAMHRVVVDQEFTTSLESDLRGISGGEIDQLQGKVQCFDLVYGCLNALYHLGLVENTGFTGDLLLFSNADNAATRYYQQKLREAARRDPADVLVISNQWLEQSDSYGKLNRWPEFEDYLRANYRLVVERTFAMREGGPIPPGDRSTAERDSYRIYLRDGAEERLGIRGGD